MSEQDDIEALIADFQRSGMRELHVRSDGFELYLSHDAGAAGVSMTGAPAAAPASSLASAPPPTMAAKVIEAPIALPDNLPPGAVIVRAPYLGTFYRSPKPGAPHYVEIGATVSAETDMCLVEVMKLFTAVRSGVAGVVHSVLATDGQLVEAEQPLFVVAPA
jgi:acetyl-CoA carboxylase biotin carboxyl carrier protein